MVQKYTKRNRDRVWHQEPLPPYRPNGWFVIFALLVVVLILSGCSAYAQEVQLACGPVELVLDTLEHQFGETQQSQQVFDRNTFELWANNDTGTWTILTYQEGDTVCIFDAGVLVIPGVYI